MISQRLFPGYPDSHYLKLTGQLVQHPHRAVKRGRLGEQGFAWFFGAEPTLRTNEPVVTQVRWQRGQ